MTDLRKKIVLFYGNNWLKFTLHILFVFICTYYSIFKSNNPSEMEVYDHDEASFLF